MYKLIYATNLEFKEQNQPCNLATHNSFKFCHRLPWLIILFEIQFSSFRIGLKPLAIKTKFNPHSWQRGYLKPHRTSKVFIPN